MHSRVYSEDHLCVISDSNGTFLFVDYENNSKLLILNVIQLIMTFFIDLGIVGFRQLIVPEPVVCIKLSQGAGIFCTQAGHVYVFEIPAKLAKSAKKTQYLIQQVTCQSKKTSSFIKKNTIKLDQQSLTVASIMDHGPGFLNFSLRHPTSINYHVRLSFPLIKHIFFFLHYDLYSLYLYFNLCFKLKKNLFYIQFFYFYRIPLLSNICGQLSILLLMFCF
jgi:hypothetical protein